MTFLMTWCLAAMVFLFQERIAVELCNLSLKKIIKGTPLFGILRWQNREEAYCSRLGKIVKKKSGGRFG